MNLCVPMKDGQQISALLPKVVFDVACCFRSITCTKETPIFGVQRCRSISGALNAEQGSLDSNATTLTVGELVFSAASSGEARLLDTLPFTRRQNVPLRLLHLQAVRPILTS